MALRIASAVLWFFAAWSMAAGAALFFNADGHLGVFAGAVVALLILHRDIAAAARQVARASGVVALAPHSGDMERPAPPM